MYRIALKKRLAAKIYLFQVEAPAVAAKVQPGQFVMVRAHERGERIPLTAAGWDRDKGLLSVVLSAVGKTTSELATLKTGDTIANVVGPLGRPTEINSFGTVVCVAGGYGVAAMLPIAQAMKEAGNRVFSILGARSGKLLFWKDRLAAASEELIITTDDGSEGRQGVVTQPLREIMERERVDRVIAIGPPMMMKFSAVTTKPFGVSTVVSLNSIMVDGTGMCGSCRVEVGGDTMFACVHGPEFDGHAVDWDLLLVRQQIYLDKEKQSLRLWRRRRTPRAPQARKGGR
ncbi:MAG: sulfide/dihydroorotate dehydrogenase-like FAD/NAD-binding protein [Dehalococcoidia bacterium]